MPRAARGRGRVRLNPLEMHEFNARIADGRAYAYDSPLPAPPLLYQDASSDERAPVRSGAAPGAGADLLLEQIPVASPESQAALDDLGPPTAASTCFYCAVVRPQALEQIQPVWWQTVQEFLDVMETSRGATNPVLLCKDMAGLFARHCQVDGMEWSARSLYDHYFTQLHSNVSHPLSIDQRIRDLEQRSQHLRDHGSYVMSPDGVRLPLENATQQLVVISKELDRMYKLRQDTTRSAASLSLTAPRGVRLYRALPAPSDLARHGTV